MPADDRLRPDDRNCAENAREPAIEPHQQKAIGIVELRTLRYLPAQHIELMAQDEDFCSSFALGLKSNARKPRISWNSSIIRW